MSFNTLIFCSRSSHAEASVLYIVHVTTNESISRRNYSIIEINKEFVYLRPKNLGVNVLRVKLAEVKQAVALISYRIGVFSIDRAIIEKVEWFTLSNLMFGDCGRQRHADFIWYFSQ